MPSREQVGRVAIQGRISQRLPRELIVLVNLIGLVEMSPEL